MKVFLLSHTRNDVDLDGFKIIGIFSSEQIAEHAMEQLRSQPGFKDYQQGFNIGSYVLDKAFWVEGFG
jgi:homoserine kinase type II